ncbi:MAG: peptidoglycan-binding protein, partial [Selenomonadaceae bacterium]|nr:peptidoglycan-binding protein [Selenomonadaceae bacterium]
MRRHTALVLGILMFWLAFYGMAMASGILVKEGVRGDDVRRVQLLLISRGYLTGEADGVCGKDTVKAIEQFQREAGLEADGICGQETFELLEKQAKEREAAETEEVPVGGVVKLGLHGPGVSHVQELLMAKGYLSGTADGVCGSQTAGAIARFQEAMGLKADGV